MVAERVPRKLADEAVILVEIVPRVGEHELWVDAAGVSKAGGGDLERTLGIGFRVDTE